MSEAFQEMTMLTVKDRPHYKLPAITLIEWLEKMPKAWWLVDGDPHLEGVLDLPCPTDELVAAIREVGKGFLFLARDDAPQGNGGEVAVDRLDPWGDTTPRGDRRILRLSWEDADSEWLLVEDEAMED